MYVCEYCPFNTESIRQYVYHFRFHVNIPNVTFKCCNADCIRQFRTYHALKSHVLRDHLKVSSRQRPGLFVNQKFAESGKKFICNKPECVQGETYANAHELICHLKNHIKLLEPIQCPFESCSSKFKVKSTFTSHISRKHRLNQSGHIAKKYLLINNDSVELELSNEEQDEFLMPMPSESAEPSDIAMIDNSIQIDNETGNNFLRNLALFYLKLQGKLLLPESQIELIITEFQKFHELNQLVVEKKVSSKLRSFDINLPDEFFGELHSVFLNDDYFSKSNNGPLKTSRKRKSYFQKNFCYIPPKEIRLGKNNKKREQTFHIISIKDSLSMLLKHYSNKIDLTPGISRDDSTTILNDVVNGTSFMEKEVNSECLYIVLYQDAFEVVNPLGSAKKKHKLIGMYFTLVNLEPHQRSNIDHMQLVLLCSEGNLKYFGQEAIFGPVIKELKNLEDNGLLIANGKNIKCRLHSIAGDNLGSHMIGGFLENFVCEYFCRYCCISKTEFQESEIPKLGQPRTVNNYEEQLKHKQDHNLEHFMGIKANSLFNDLTHFNIVGGLPPCLGHDMFEGIVSYDLKIFLRYFITTVKWFTVDQLNKQIDSFDFKGTDALDKPSPISLVSDRIGGHAIQNWVLLRLLPLFIGVFVQDVEDKVWQLYLLLKLNSELLCAPSISLGQISYLDVSLRQYVEERKKYFPDIKLRPKHHFLLHYPGLILQFGPLIRLWTLRFESKHSYFKECARKLKNYKHLSKTLSGRHQLLQAYFSSGNLFKADIDDDNSSSFEPNLFSTKIKNDLVQLGIQIGPNLTVSSKVVFKGIQYKANMLLILSSNEKGLLFGKILNILVSNGNIFFSVDTLQGIPNPEYGLYILSEDYLDTKVVSFSKIVEKFPISPYRVQEETYVSLKHHVMR